MFVEQLRRAVAASPRAELHTVSGLLWKAFAAGQVSEAEASALSSLIESRRALSVQSPPLPRRIHVGSRPRTPASMERRRRWAASGALPPALASRFTAAETAVLDHIAALAGVSRTTVKNALRAAQGLGFVRIEERRISAWRNAPNIVTITSREWNTWLDKRRKREGANPRLPRLQESNKDASALRNRAWAAEGQRTRSATDALRRSQTGSVSTRASKYSLCSRTCGDVPSHSFQDGQYGHSATEELESAAIGGNVLMVAGARAEKGAQFIV